MGHEFQDVPAAILAGGQGTRLRAAVADRPKVLAPVAGRPFLSYLLDQLAAAGVRRVVLCTGYRAEQVEAAFGSRYVAPTGMLALTYSREGRTLGTAGALRLALPELGAVGSTVLVLNGDSYCDADLSEFLAAHRQGQTLASILLTQVDDAARFGQVDLDAAGRVTAFREKGSRAGPGLINAGVYLFQRQVIAEIPPGVPLSLERQVLPGLIERGVHGCVSGSRGGFIDIGTPESFRAAEAFFAGAAPLPSTTRRRFVLLDRDGTVIADRHYLHDPDQVELLPGAAAGLRRLTALGLGLVLVTNQSGIGRGYFTRADVDRVHARLAELLAAEGVRLDGIFLCPHGPDERCACRKPSPGLAHQAALALGFALEDCFVIGDKACDIDLGTRVGAATFLVRTGYGAELEASGAYRPDHCVDDLAQAAETIAQLLGSAPRAAAPHQIRNQKSEIRNPEVHA